MSEATVTFRVDENLKNNFAAAAEAIDQTSSQLLREFMRQVVERQQNVEYKDWFRKQVALGLEAANSGKLLTSQEVEAKFSARRAAALNNGRRVSNG